LGKKPHPEILCPPKLLLKENPYSFFDKIFFPFLSFSLNVPSLSPPFSILDLRDNIFGSLGEGEHLLRGGSRKTRRPFPIILPAVKRIFLLKEDSFLNPMLWGNICMEPKTKFLRGELFFIPELGFFCLPPGGLEVYTNAKLTLLPSLHLKLKEKITKKKREFDYFWFGGFLLIKKGKTPLIFTEGIKEKVEEITRKKIEGRVALAVPAEAADSLSYSTPPANFAVKKNGRRVNVSGERCVLLFSEEISENLKSALKKSFRVDSIRYKTIVVVQCEDISTWLTIRSGGREVTLTRIPDEIYLLPILSSVGPLFKDAYLLSLKKFFCAGFFSLLLEGKEGGKLLPIFLPKKKNILK